MAVGLSIDSLVVEQSLDVSKPKPYATHDGLASISTIKQGIRIRYDS